MSLYVQLQCKAKKGLLYTLLHSSRIFPSLPPPTTITTKKGPLRVAGWSRYKHYPCRQQYPPSRTRSLGGFGSGNCTPMHSIPCRCTHSTYTYQPNITVWFETFDMPPSPVDTERVYICVSACMCVHACTCMHGVCACE